MLKLRHASCYTKIVQFFASLAKLGLEDRKNSYLTATAGPMQVYCQGSLLMLCKSCIIAFLTLPAFFFCSASF